ncbi:MAG TPA: tetratricopeptide repeat protein, partial [Albitalea sp.]|nr:tetratricopeptide repeat protein [Albitalea sp.]
MTLSQQHYDGALALHRSGRLDEANAAYRALLADEPANAGVLHLLGVVEGQCGRYTQAVQLIEEALRHAPQLAAAHANLGNAQHALARYDDARASYQEALRLQPGHRAALLGHGKACWSLGWLSAALDSFDAVLASEPDLAEALLNRGDLLLALGRRDEAVASLHRAVACGADAQHIAYLLASLGIEPVPGVAPQDYVRELFDGYAERFDMALVDKLGYRTPQRIAERVLRDAPAAHSLDVLDLGCGTGLCGPLLRPLARRLVGVDLSDSMLAKARERSIYDELACGEIVAWLAGQGAEYDLVIAADVFVYIGDLALVFAAV